MARCKRCGKSKLFLKLNYEGLCEECEEKERQELAEKLRREKAAREAAALQRLESIPTHEIILSDKPRKRQRGYEPVNTSNITPKGVYDRFVVFDTETTGLAPSRDRIIELAAIRFIDGEPVELFSTLVNPEREIPPEISELNIITDDMVADAPTISEILPAFEEFIGDDLLVAHNLEFDLKFAFHSGSTLMDTKRKYIDTLEQAQKLLKKPRRTYCEDEGYWDYDYESDYDVDDHKLDTLCSYYNIIRPYEHRAAADALATGDLFLELVEEKQSR